jgi:hypothetical protein
MGSLDQARTEINTYIDAYQHRPHSGLAYLTPAEVATTWRPDPDMLQTRATWPVNADRVHVSSTCIHSLESGPGVQVQESMRFV